jgi:energy-coupling factor transporter ATP-binding protein EcfA2
MNNIQEDHHLQEPDSFETWINERPKWLQSAARLLIDSKRIPNDAEIKELARLCFKEASGTKEGYSKIVPGALAKAAQRPELRINKISGVSGVNAIKDGASIAFGNTNLAVVYGANGSGKTSFSRILKQACGSRAKDELLGNVFSSEPPPAAADIDLSISGKSQSVPWTLSGGVLEHLRNVHVFDTKAAQMYMGKNEATYEPSRMRFNSSLIAICDRVSTFLKQEKKTLASKLPSNPPMLIHTAPIQWLNTLKATTKLEVIEQKCEVSKELDDERVATETALAQKDVAGRLKVIAQDRLVYKRIKDGVDSLKSALVDEAIQAVITARSDANKKRNIANEEAKMVFANVALDGVGQSTWMALWKHAKEFSEKHAYPNANFPSTVAGFRCVLCQQEFTIDGKERMDHFQVYVQGKLEADARTAENLRDELTKRMLSLPLEHDWLIQMNQLKVSEEVAKQYMKALTLRRKAVDTADSLAAVPIFDWSPLDKACQNISNTFDVEEKTLKELQQDGQRLKLETRIKELQSTQWLNQNKAAILEERKRLNSISTFDSAIRLTSTNALTTKSNELAKVELDAGYQERFAKELRVLGGIRLSVKPESKQKGKGKIIFGLTLQGSKSAVAAEKILSEGEIRVVALAAFLADITGSGQKSPFIFDDPISSLDQDFEEKVVARLVALAMDRQVIIFTHRLSLLSQVESVTRKLKDQARENGLAAPVSVTVETLRKLGKDSGITAKLSLRDSKPAKAVVRIKNEFLPQLRKHVENGDADAFEREAWQTCSEFRILVEKCIESVLLNEVLVRFRRDIQTKGRLSKLTKIEQSDCDLIDDLMTRYSVFEHSQSDELPAPCPDLQQIEHDGDALSSWINAF